MLVLSREVGESVIIGKGIFITCLGIDERGEMLIGIDAPKSLSIDRYEVRESKERKGVLSKKRDRY